ncbi:MAG: hypothetical protein HYX53_02085 [Chloroflexi bacterium]|nr:hypothetical protein [Chloroflexota bacterium]
MTKLYVRVKDAIQNFNHREEGQDGFEYLLVSGVVTVAVVAAIALGGPGQMNAIWTAVKDAVVAAL